MVAPKVCTGFEFGTTAGAIGAPSIATNRLFDIGAAPTITSTGAVRTGTYCLELSPTASLEWVGWSSGGGFPASQDRLVLGMAIRFPTSLPAGNCNLVVLDQGGSFGVLQFNSGDSTLRVTIGGGTQQTGPTVSADTWYHVELYAKISANPWTLDWWVDGSQQTQATGAQAAGTFTRVVLGDDSSQTMVCRYDDLVLWTDTADLAAPFGAHKVVLLTVDTGTAYVLNGAAATFSTFTANGTIDAAFTVTKARDTTDEWPPTIGASADGLIQDATSTTDNVEIAMTSYTLQSGESIAGVRMEACGWAVSTTGATFGFRSYNGTTETILQAGTVDPNFDNSTTTPAWCCKMLTEADFDTQTELDGLRFRVGFSSDAAPDIGIHAIAAELAVKEAAGAVTGAAVGAYTFTGTAAGVPETFGQAAASLTFTGSAAGIDRAVGVATGSLTFTAIGSGIAGTPPVTGAAVGAYTFTGIASGVPETFGQAATALGFTATAAGIPRTSGAATGGYTFTSTAAGIDRALGAANGSISFGATAGGVPDVHGAAAGSYTFTGTGNGFAGTPPVTGTGQGIYTFTSTAAGIDRALGAAATSLTFSGTAAGITDVHGTAVAPFTVTATAIGQRKTFAQAAAALAFAATGSAFVGELPVPAGIPLYVAGTNSVLTASSSRLTTGGRPHDLTVPAGSHVVEAR